MNRSGNEHALPVHRIEGSPRATCPAACQRLRPSDDTDRQGACPESRQLGREDTADSTRYGLGGNRMGGTIGSHDDRDSTLSVSGLQSADASGTTPSPTSSASGLSGSSSSSGSSLGKK